jgi:hypothetical protein
MAHLVCPQACRDQHAPKPPANARPFPLWQDATADIAANLVRAGVAPKDIEP